MGLRPSKRHTLDRIDGDRDYGPDNCRWATAQQQAENRSSNHWFVFEGRTITLADLSRELDLPYKTVHARMEAGWTLEMIISTPLRKQRRPNRS